MVGSLHERLLQTLSAPSETSILKQHQTTNSEALRDTGESADASAQTSPFVANEIVSSKLIAVEVAHGPEHASERVHTLDYLRGTLALGVMVYHWKSVNNIHLGWFLDQAMTKIGPYSVCAFFVLSGMSLGLVYSGRNIDRKFLVEFAIKRLFRIVPLFWITIILTILLDAWQRGSMADFPSFHRLALNLSMLFSWVEPTASIPMGGWSIADEMVFYSLFPVVLFLSRKSSQTAFLIVIIALAFGAVFAFHLLDPSVNWDPQWALYVNPLNHLFLFVVGVVTAVRRLRLPLTTRWMAPALFFCILAFVMVPANGAELFSGFGRVCYSSLAILICWIVLDWKSGVGSFAPLLTWIGWISYGVYLLHPIFIRASIFFIAYQLNRNPALISLCVGIPATLIGATVSWVCFEKPMMQLGRRFLKTRA